MNVPRKPPRRRLDGVLLLDKTLGESSNRALQAARRLYDAEKAGHTGTLDPLATGLLPLCFGEATKFSSDLLNADKRYVAVVQLGVTTDTADTEGKVLRRRPVEVDRRAVEKALAAHTGGIDQIPPMYSALKRDGKPLYEYARAGIELERAAELEPNKETLNLLMGAYEAKSMEIEASQIKKKLDKLIIPSGKTSRVLRPRKIVG